MNIQEKDILQTIFTNSFFSQRILAEMSGHSLGIVNRSIANLIKDGYLDENIQPTLKAREEYKNKLPKNAIILAAGFGMRMVPINLEVPKGLIEVNGEPLIERLIKQLHEVGVKEIYIIVGFMKEQYEYLIDEYEVQLIVNSDYSIKNNLHSMKLVSDKLFNTYVVPCDIWCDTNPFCECEMYSWYMVSDLMDDDSVVRINRKKDLVIIPKTSSGNAMIGIAYLDGDNCQCIKTRIEELCSDSKYDEDFWETALYENGKMMISARIVHASKVVEINTYEQLRELDGASNQLQSELLDVIAEIFGVSTSDITGITVLKKGMTNRSFLFTCNGEKYIMRIPGEGTDQLINRRQEAQVYKVIEDKGLCDNVIYLNPENGYKITKFIEGVRVCDSDNTSDLQKCMKKLKDFHDMQLKVEHTFDVFGQIEFYESLWNGEKSIYRDYQETKQNVFSLKDYINEHIFSYCLAHIDAVPDNFLFYYNNMGKEEVQLTDWEYAGMQDPHIDIAMFCIYSFYDRKQVDKLVDIYFDHCCSRAIRIKIYCYIAACGLLWSNWCEYKRRLGVEFGEYSLRQYRYAKEYYRIARKEMETGYESGK
ncbi:MAG: NTP transferase domain-containing protein [Lachnospiraceae bacterium]|nr:NTP transferase domain-containing protein [Lachnospiraceae bacterium]